MSASCAFESASIISSYMEKFLGRGVLVAVQNVVMCFSSMTMGILSILHVEPGTECAYKIQKV